MAVFHYHWTDHGHGFGGLTNNYLEVLWVRFAWLSGWPGHISRFDPGRLRLTEEYEKSSFRHRWLKRWTHEQWHEHVYGPPVRLEQNEEIDMARDGDKIRDLSSALINMLNNPGDELMQKHAVYILQKHGYGSRIRSDEYFTEQADMLGIDPAWFGREVVEHTDIDGKQFTARYTVTGIDPTRPKNVIMMTTQKGGIRYASIDWLRERMGEPVDVQETPTTRSRDIQL